MMGTEQDALVFGFSGNCCLFGCCDVGWTTAPVLLAAYVAAGNGLNNGVHCGL